MLVLISSWVLLLKLSESIDHDTANQILEQQLHKNNINSIKESTAKLETIHIITNGSTRV